MADWYISSVAWAALPQFAASTAYTVGNIIRPLTTPAFGHEYAFRCTTAGTSSTEPTWPAPNGSTITSGGATFTNVSGQSAYGWAAAAGTLWSMIFQGPSGRLAANDRAFVSSDHSETNASANYAFSSGGAFGVIQMISVNRAGSVPPAAADILAGAAITTSGASTLVLDTQVPVYWQGFTFTLAGTGAAIYLGSAIAATKTQYFKNCAFVFTTSSTTATIGPNNPNGATLDNTTVQFNAAGQRFSSSNYIFDLKWINTPSAILGTMPTTLFVETGTVGSTTVLRGIDLSALTGTLISGGNNQQKILLDSCRIASGLTRLGSIAASDSASHEIELVNCYNGTLSISERHTSAGDLTTDRVTYMTGGAADDFGNFAHRMATSTRSDKWTMTLDSFWLDVENTAIGASHTATVELVSSASLNTDDFQLKLEYLSTSGSPVASLVDSIANPLTATAALPTSTATWNSPPSTPVYQHIQVSFTPQQAGRLRGQVRLGKPSTTVWINPQIAVT